MNKRQTQYGVTDEGKVKLQQLHARISDVILEHPQFEEGFYLYAWLHVVKLDVDKAERLIRESAKWRKEKDIKRVLKQDFHPGIQKSFPVNTSGRTKAGFPVWTVPAGRFRFASTITEYGRQAVEFYWLQLLCKGETAIVECTRRIEENEHGDVTSRWPPQKKAWLLLDMKGLLLSDTLSREALSVVLTLFQLMTSHFPFIEGTIVFLNAGRFLELFFKIIRPMLSRTSVDMVVFGSDEKKWKPFILQHIDAGEIEANYGGTLQEQK